MGIKLKRLSIGSNCRISLKQTVIEATEFLGATPKDMTRAFEEQDLKIIWTGIVWENAFSHEKCLKQIANAISMNNHSSVFEWKRRWFEMDWRLRHGWLVLFEGYRATGIPIREGIKSISEFVNENFE